MLSLVGRAAGDQRCITHAWGRCGDGSGGDAFGAIGPVLLVGLGLGLPPPPASQNRSVLSRNTLYGNASGDAFSAARAVLFLAPSPA